MGLFKKDKINSNTPSMNSPPNNTELHPSEKVKKKRHIGFGHKEKKKESEIRTERTNLPVEYSDINHQKTNLLSVSQDEPIKGRELDTETDLFLENTLSEPKKNKQDTTKQEIQEDWTQVQKRNALLQKDLKGKPVFLEDTGEQLGIVFDTIRDKENKVIGYKIKDSKSDAVLGFPLDQFDEDKSGLIFVPSWYTKGLKTIEKLEFKDKISPELPWLLKDQTISDEELYKIFVKHDDVIANYMDESVALRELLAGRLKILEKERLSLKEDLMDLTEKRLIKDIDRRKFSEIVMEHRRKVNVIDVNIKKCKELLDRLELTSFGMLGKTIRGRIENKEWDKQRTHEPAKNTSRFSNDYEDTIYKEKYDGIKVSYNELEEENKSLKEALDSKIDTTFEDKYHELKQNYDQLLTEYDELKLAVEKLIQKESN
jgi:hypothetical protein